jgi:hypothetical protein
MSVGTLSKQENYTVEVKYSPEAIEKKKVRFTTKNGDQFEITADELIAILVHQVNMDTLAPAFVDTEKINIVQVMRQVKVQLDEDKKKGDIISLGYEHPYPLEFALLEEVYKIASIEGKGTVLELTKELIDETKAKIKPGMNDFVKKIYASYQGLNLKDEDDTKKKKGSKKLS